MGSCFSFTEKKPMNEESETKNTNGSLKLPNNFDQKSETKKMNESQKLPHNCETILKDADPPISLSSDNHNLSQLLRSGVFLKPKNQVKYWVDERNNNCFMIFPRNLSITWSHEPIYWAWLDLKESPNETIVEVAKLKKVCWLDITGKFDTMNLTPGTEYEVVFRIKLKDQANGWDTPVNLKLVLPSDPDKPQEQTVSLRKLPTGHWIDVKVGEFIPEKSAAGEMTFSMYEHNKTSYWKDGLYLKGVAICPKRIT